MDIERILNEMTVEEKAALVSGTDFMYTNPILRLGVPSLCMSDGPHGLRKQKGSGDNGVSESEPATSFPTAAAVASSWNPQNAFDLGAAIADECRHYGVHTLLGPGVNIKRNPLCGRNFEYYSEDPFLAGVMGAAEVNGVQSRGVGVSVKHFALNNSENYRFMGNSVAGENTIRTLYFKPFEYIVKHARPATIMCAYNRINGVFCSENKWLLTDILRDEWGFDGFVMSDFVNGVHDAESSLKAGLDVEMMFTMHYNGFAIKKLLKSGKLQQEHIDRAVRNILRVLIRQVPQIKPRSKSVIGSVEHRLLAREIAEKGMVLLENNGVLPLSRDTKVMVTGPYADEANVGDQGSSRVWDKNIVTPFAGLSRVFPNASLTEGDVAVVCVGSNRKKEGEFFASASEKMKKKPKDCGGDRDSLRLEAEEVELIRSLKAQGKKVVVVLYSGCAIIVEEWKQYADAILMNYYSGCEGGTALANLLCGEKNFSGKLPFTVAKDERDYPAFLSIGQKPYEITYGYYHGYTKMDKEGIEPAYPFGYGLSYTSFAVSDKTAAWGEDTLTVTAKVKNTGSFDGAEVLQVYVGSNGAADGDDRPVKLLKGFRRVELKAGEEKTVTISIPKEELKFWTPDGWVLDEAYTVYVGTDSRSATPA